MLMKVRYKDYKEKEQEGIAIYQWPVPTDDGDRLRLYLLIPHKDDNLCDVHIVIEEVEEWLVVGKDDDYTNRALLEEELLSIPNEQTGEDLYYVWDDGVEAHIERAKRLYETYKKDIVAISS